MTIEFELRWDTYGSHGGHVSGVCSWHSTRKEAEVEMARLMAEEPNMGDWGPTRACTDLTVVKVTKDRFGNRTEES